MLEKAYERMEPKGTFLISTSRFTPRKLLDGKWYGRDISLIGCMTNGSERDCYRDQLTRTLKDLDPDTPLACDIERELKHYPESETKDPIYDIYIEDTSGPQVAYVKSTTDACVYGERIGNVFFVNQLICPVVKYRGNDYVRVTFK